jgi:hypothetical protein
MAIFRYIVKQGNHGFHHDGLSKSVRDGEITCQDGFKMTVKAGQDLPCTPNVTPCNEGSDHPSHQMGYMQPCDYTGPYDRFFVPSVSDVPPNFSDWMDYGYAERPKGPFFDVPKQMVEDLISHHGGELG